MTGVDLICEERENQLEKWDSYHDDEHSNGELAKVAASLAVEGTSATVTDLEGYGTNSDKWTLLDKYHDNRLRCLTIAGALIAAEIDREIRLMIRREAL